jgi:hypothetical protein
MVLTSAIALGIAVTEISQPASILSVSLVCAGTVRFRPAGSRATDLFLVRRRRHTCLFRAGRALLHPARPALRSATWRWTAATVHPVSRSPGHLASFRRARERPDARAVQGIHSSLFRGAGAQGRRGPSRLASSLLRASASIPRTTDNRAAPHQRRGLGGTGPRHRHRALSAHPRQPPGATAPVADRGDLQTPGTAAPANAVAALSLGTGCSGDAGQ